eukprot:4647410-Amphidinium_carterae.1
MTAWLFCPCYFEKSTKGGTNRNGPSRGRIDSEAPKTIETRRSSVVTHVHLHLLSILPELRCFGFGDG